MLAILVARYLGADQAGHFYTALPIVMMAAYLARLGLDQLAMREVAAARAIGEPIRQFVVSIAGLILMTAFICALLVALAGQPLAYYYLQPDLAWMLPVLALAVLSIALFNLAGQALRGAHAIWLSSFVLFSGHNLFNLMILAVLAFGLTHLLPPLQGVVAAYVLGAILTAVLGLYWANRASVADGEPKDRQDWGGLIRAGQPLLLYGLGTMSFQWTDTLVLAAVRPSHDVAVYNSAMKVAQSVGFVLLAVVSAAGPRFAALYRAQRMEELQRAYTRATLLTFAMALPIVLLLVLAGEAVMGLFGDDFRSGSLPLVILAVGQLFAALAGPVGQLLIAAKLEIRLRNLTLFMAVINIPLNYIFAPLWGAAGSAVATALSIVLVNLGAVYLATRSIGIGLFGRHKAIVSG